MKVPLSWLGELVELSMPLPELARRLTMAGLEVEESHEVGSDWRAITVARVVSLDPHPRLGNLNVVQLDLSDHSTTVVTGAQNLRAGDVVPHVAPGGRLPGGEVGSRAFSGITSEGMVCSGDELAISPDKDGIYVFEPDAPVGQPVAEFLRETVFDVYVGPNRPDCMSVVGLAREVHALFGAPYRPAFVRFQDSAAAAVTGSPGEPAAGSLLTLDIEDPVGCPRFTASIVRGIQIGPSPHWLQRRLYFAGVRPISNAVDVTNYVMLELGQPLHAFDRARLGSERIVVRRARDGQTLRTLDGEQRTLNASMMVVTDGERPRSLAGIMGGEDSEIADSTSEVVLEGASWDRAAIRLTSAALGLASEASRRFGRGVDPDLTALAVTRATELTLELAGGRAAAGLADTYPGRAAPRVIDLRASQIDALMGMHYPSDQVVQTLTDLGFGVDASAGEALQVTVPGWRRFDVEGRADLAEEVGRVVGYEALPATMIRGRVPEPRPDGDAGYADELRARRVLAAAGLQEVITYSLVDPEQPVALSDATPIRVPNPQSTEQSVLRTSLVGGVLGALRANLRQRERVLLFELGRAWRGELNPLPMEQRLVSIALSGPRAAAYWSTAPEALDFFDLKGVVDVLCAAFRVQPRFLPAHHSNLHPGRTAELCVGDRRLGLLGQLHPAAAERLDLDPHVVFVAELDFDQLLAARPPFLTVSTPSRFPPADRDIAVVVAEDVANGDLEAEIRQAAEPLLEHVRLFDVYRGAPIPAGHKNVAYALRYRAPDRTLADEEVTEVHARVEQALQTRFGGEIRGRPQP